MSFSIIIPFFNAKDCIKSAIDSVKMQEYNDYEIILVDDCSNDGSYEFVQNLIKNDKSIKLLQTQRNLGPGDARNLALKYASKDWILFLDCDDRLAINALATLHSNIDKSIDCYAYTMGGGNSPRNDISSFYKERILLLKDYISLKMDGSAIFSIYKRDFLLKNNIFFSKDFHEDVYFMFLVYYYANDIKMIDESIYIKSTRKGSITNSISKRHIDGFLFAYQKIYTMIKDDAQYLVYFYQGLVGLIAVKLRDIFRHAKDDKNMLYEYLWEQIKDYKIDLSVFVIETKYLKLFISFVNVMKQKITNKAQILDEIFGEILEKSWSCYDLHHSIFLAHDEIRACCKRFFVNDTKKGDVVLCKIDSTKDIFGQIIFAKQNLFRNINTGAADCCYGCPHLEFKQWGDLNALEKISFEYHSLCNLKCVYCSPKYYGGKKPLFNVELFIQSLIDNKFLAHIKSVVWGGGEPTIEKSFDKAISHLSKHINIKQMVITNALHYSATLQDLINTNKVHITTSIDSGSEAKFKEVRGVNGLHKVLTNLNSYAKYTPHNISIKYILMPQNISKSEIDGFIELMKQYDLLKCNFHISCNFNEMQVSKMLVKMASYLYAMLKENGVCVVFFDELLRERINLNLNDLDEIKDFLGKYHLDCHIEDYTKYDEICIWGNSTQTKLLLNKSLFCKNISKIHIIDSRSIGKKLLDYTIKDPQGFINQKCHILIGAVQGTPRIYKEFVEMGFDENRLIKGVVL